jgi:hypothetical protein
MPLSDFLNNNLSAQCDDLAGEINKTYQHLPWALKHEAVARLKRQVHALAKSVSRAQESKSLARTQKNLQDAIALTHECVPLMSLCLKKNLLSADLHNRWAKRLNGIGKGLDEWLRVYSEKY